MACTLLVTCARGGGLASPSVASTSSTRRSSAMASSHRRAACASVTSSKDSTAVPSSSSSSPSRRDRRFRAPSRRGRALVVVASTREDPDGSKRAPDPSARGTVDAADDDAFREWLLKSEMPKTGKRALRALSSLPLAISEFLVIAGFSALGTVIEQNKGTQWYVTNYPVDDPALGFIDYPLILNLGLDHIYTEWYFLGLLGALAASLTACTFTRQLPVWKVAADWKFLDRPRTLLKMDEAETLPRARSEDLADALARRGYQVFVKGKALYAFKGLVGRLAPIGVHAGLLLTLGGAAYSGLGGLGGSIMAPEGTSFVIGDGLRRGGSVFAPRPAAAKDSVVVNDFTIEYLPNGQVSQFFSDLSVVDAKDGSEKQRKTISVNVPLRQGGVTMYQTDWEIASVRLRVLNEDDGGATAGAEDAALPGAGAAGAEDAASFAAKAQARQGDLGPAPETLFPEARADGDASAGETLSLPMANLEGVGNFQGRIWGAFLPLNPDASPGTPEARVGVSLLARDFQSVAAYASDGSFAGVRRPGSGRPIVVDGLTLVIDDVKGSTGLELKTDPGVPWVYAGFAGLMVTSFLSLLSHSQVWAVGEESSGLLHVYVYFNARVCRQLY